LAVLLFLVVVIGCLVVPGGGGGSGSDGDGGGGGGARVMFMAFAEFVSRKKRKTEK
jgi:hypothetical protein